MDLAVYTSSAEIAYRYAELPTSVWLQMQAQVLRQVFYLHAFWLTKLFISPRLVKTYQFQPGSKPTVWLQGRRTARLDACGIRSGFEGLTYCKPRCAAITSLLLTSDLPVCTGVQKSRWHQCTPNSEFKLNLTLDWGLQRIQGIL
jgi:hypothetical protein